MCGRGGESVPGDGRGWGGAAQGMGGARWAQVAGGASEGSAAMRGHCNLISEKRARWQEDQWGGQSGRAGGGEQGSGSGAGGGELRA